MSPLCPCPCPQWPGQLDLDPWMTAQIESKQSPPSNVYGVCPKELGRSAPDALGPAAALYKTNPKGKEDSRHGGTTGFYRVAATRLRSCI